MVRKKKAVSRKPARKKAPTKKTAKTEPVAPVVIELPVPDPALGPDGVAQACGTVFDLVLRHYVCEIVPHVVTEQLGKVPGSRTLTTTGFAIMTHPVE